MYHVVAGWSLAPHTRPLFHIRHPSRAREERADGESTLAERDELSVVEDYTDQRSALQNSKICLQLLFTV